MKKTLPLFLSLALCFALCACGKSEAAKAADELILSLGEITLESDSTIANAEKAVKALSEEDYNHLDNLQILNDAKEKYLSLKAAEIDKAINSIEDVRVSNIGVAEKDIANAIKLFDEAEPAVKDKVRSNTRLKELVDQLDQIKAARIVSMIDNIGTINLESKTVLNNIDLAYEKLSDVQKALVSNYDKFEDSKKGYDEYLRKTIDESKAAWETALSKFTKTEDSVGNVTWYRASNFPAHINDRCYCLPYIGVTNSGVMLRVQIAYSGNDWIFFTRVILDADGVSNYRLYDYFDVKRDNQYGSVWEYVDFVASDSDIRDLTSLAYANTSTVRLAGDMYYKDIVLSQEDKQIIKDTLDAYLLLLCFNGPTMIFLRDARLLCIMTQNIKKEGSEHPT